jgi:hypothetical protein
MLKNAKRSRDARAAAHQDYRVGAVLVEQEIARWRMDQQRIALPNDSMKESEHHPWLNPDPYVLRNGRALDAEVGQLNIGHLLR